MPVAKCCTNRSGWQQKVPQLIKSVTESYKADHICSKNLQIMYEYRYI